MKSDVGQMPLHVPFFLKIQRLWHQFIFQEEFGKNVMTLRGTLYIPKVMVFYAYWGVKVQAYLSAFRRSVEEFKDLGVLVEYGMVDLAQEAGKKCKSKLRSICFLFQILYQNVQVNITVTRLDNFKAGIFNFFIFQSFVLNFSCFKAM